ncbi:hypothetical protein AAC387_Pa05g3735 [Persea americana]
MAFPIRASPLSLNSHQTVGLTSRIFDYNSIRRKNRVDNGGNITSSTNKTRDHENNCFARCTLLVIHSQMRTTSATLSFNTLAISPKKIGSLFLKPTSPIIFAATAAATSSSDRRSPLQPPSLSLSADEVELSAVESVLTLPLAPVDEVDSLSVEAVATKKIDPKARALKAAKAAKSDASTLEKKAKILKSGRFQQPKPKERNPKLLRSSDQLMNKLDHYEILKYPLKTESAIKNMEFNNTLVFIVDVKADKKMIRDAFKKLCDVQTKRVNTSIRPDGMKKAFVQLAPDHNASDVARMIGIL